MKIVVVLLLLIPCSIQAQVKLSWTDMADVQATKDYDADMGIEYLYPTFGSKINTFDGKEVYIHGFLIPYDVEDGLYALSAYPYQSCFFCGKAGPESVIQLNLSAKRRYIGLKMDEQLTFKGTLKLNRTDPNQLFYILEDAELYYGK